MRMRHFSILVLTLVLALTLGMTASADFPADLRVIESGAFEGATEFSGILTLPGQVTTVGSRAFARTGLYALKVPAGCTSLAADALAGGKAVYVRLNGAGTVISGSAMTDVPFVFGPAGSAASGVSGFYAAETLRTADGLYYSVEEYAAPLCAVDGSALSGVVTIPKMVDGAAVRSLAQLNLKGCQVTGLSVPSYLSIPEGMNATAYDAMSITAPVPSVTAADVGDTITWTAEITGAFGEVAYIWTFDVDGAVSSVITAEPSVHWQATAAGTCTASVKAVDTVNDEATAVSTATVEIAAVTTVNYRALVVGNIYSGTSSTLPGCDTDAYAMRTMLRSMSGTPYSVKLMIDATSDEVRSAIASTFGSAGPQDVSLFYFSGHGGSDGSLAGASGTHISAKALRTWLDSIPGTKIVIVDACYSGMMIGKSENAAPSAFTNAFVGEFSSYRKEAELAANGYVVMTACSKDQLSQSLSDGTVSFGAFTYGVCYGGGYDSWNQTSLGNLPADTDGNGQITLSEAYSMARQRINWLGSMVQNGLNQYCQSYGDDNFVLWEK